VTGGTIVDGTYAVTACEYYESGCGSSFFPAPQATTMVIAGVCVQETVYDQEANATSTVNFVLTPSCGGVTAQVAITCPSSTPQGGTIGFTATDTTLTLFFPMGGSGGSAGQVLTLAGSSSVQFGPAPIEAGPATWDPGYPHAKALEIDGCVAVMEDETGR
jgi:hypothetical protein